MPEIELLESPIATKKRLQAAPATRGRSAARRWAALILTLILSSAEGADRQAVTDNGQRVLLRDTGRWELIQAPETSAGSTEAGLAPVEATPSRESDSTEPAKPPIDKVGLKERLEQLPWQDPVFQYTAGAAALLALITLGLLIHFLVLVPRRKRKGLKKAYRILGEDSDRELPDAEQLLETAIQSGLKKAQRAEAHFAMAYVKARREKFEEALADVHKADRSEPETAWLEIWLLLRLKKYEDAWDVFEGNRQDLEGLPGAKRLAGLACLYLGWQRWRERRVEGAVSFFDRLRTLGVFTDKIPQNVSGHQITLGTVALFDRHIDAAEEHFNGVLAQESRDDRTALEANLGLLLCTWRRNDYPDIDADLETLVESVLAVASGDLDSPVSSDTEKNGTDPNRRFTPERKRLGDDALLTRNALLWLAIARIFRWFSLPKHSKLPESERETLRKRLKEVSRIDPEMGDPDFVMGLIDYYFAYETMREQATKSIEGSGVKIPEAELLVRREKKLTEIESKSLDRFLALIKSYLGDKTVPRRAREELKEKLERFRRFRDREEEFTVAETSDEDEASLTEIRSRGQILHKRIIGIVRPTLALEDEKSRERFDNLINEMTETTQSIARTAQHLEDTERELMVTTGEFLFGEEEIRDRPGGSEHRQEGHDV